MASWGFGTVEKRGERCLRSIERRREDPHVRPTDEIRVGDSAGATGETDNDE